MAMTVQPEMKLMAETLMMPMASSTGLIITPPPIPQILPIRQAKSATRKQMTIMENPHFL